MTRLGQTLINETYSDLCTTTVKSRALTLALTSEVGHSHTLSSTTCGLCGLSVISLASLIMR